MKIRELKALAREKLSSGMTKQEAYDHIVSLNLIRIHDVANAVRDIASNFYKQKYKNHNYFLIGFIVIAGLIQALSSIVFPDKANVQTLPADIFLMLTYIAIAIGVYVHYKLSFSAAILLSIISIYMSYQNVAKPEIAVNELVHYGIIALLGLAIIGMSGFLYSKYFRGYDIISADKNQEIKRETYFFKLEE